MFRNSSSECESATCQVKGFKDLPVEVISLILEFLPYTYLQDARLVCQLWYAASHSPNLLKKEVIMCLESESSDILNNLMKSRKPIWNICFKADLIIEDIEKENSPNLRCGQAIVSLWTSWFKSFDERFWMCYGPKLRSLSFNYCGILKNELLKTLSLCPELKSIELIGCKLESGSHEKSAIKCLPKLLHLESLRIDGTFIQYLDDKGDLFDNILSCTSRLKSLMLINCMYERGLFGTTYLTPEHVLGYLQQNTGSVDNVSFVHKVYENEVALIRLLKIPNLQLKTLETNYLIPKELISRLRSLRVLRLKGNFRGEPSADIISELKDLRCLELKFCYVESLSNLHLLKNLTSLSIGMVFVHLTIIEEVNVNALLLAALCSEVNTVLKKLSLRMDPLAMSIDSLCLNASTLKAIAKTHPALTDLEVDWPFNISNGESLHLAIKAIFKYQVSLRSLCLTNLEILNGSGVLETLSGERLYSDLDENSSQNSLARLKNLRKLDLEGLRGDEIFCLAQSNLPDLTDLSLECFVVTSDDLEIFFKNHPRIERLSLDRGVIPDQTIDVIVHSLPRLKYAFIASYNVIAEESKNKLKKHCKAAIFGDLALD